MAPSLGKLGHHTLSWNQERLHFRLRASECRHWPAAVSMRLQFLYWFEIHCCAAAKLLQSCPTLCDPIDSSPPGSAVPGILQARILEWVAIFFPNAWKWKVKVKLLSHVQVFTTPWTAAYQAPLSMGFSRQEYWSGVTLPYISFIYNCQKLEAAKMSFFLNLFF